MTFFKKTVKQGRIEIAPEGTRWNMPTTSNLRFLNEPKVYEAPWKDVPNLRGKWYVSGIAIAENRLWPMDYYLDSAGMWQVSPRTNDANYQGYFDSQAEAQNALKNLGPVQKHSMFNPELMEIEEAERIVRIHGSE